MPTDPVATYRVQLTASFDFDAAASIVDYLGTLGVSHLYCSPYLQAARGSTHGYDVVDPTRVNEELGGAAGHARLRDALARRGLGQILDVVPNHMGTIGGENSWWWDVLENGRASRYAAHFDIDWRPPEEKLRDRLLVPVLGDHYGRVLEAGELAVRYAQGRFRVCYHQHELPVAPRSLDDLLRRAAARSGSRELEFVADALGALPPATATDRESVERRHRDKEVLADALAYLSASRPNVAAAIDAEVGRTNGDPDALDELLERQNYRLAYWRAARRDLGYRRFFDVDSLVAVRVEDPRVFADSHGLILGWLADGTLDGVRVDHVDGLWDPEEYLARLRAAAPHALLFVEKILATGESLRSSWPIEGTTGYEFLPLVGGLFVDPAGEEALTRFYAEFTGDPVDYPALVREQKQLVLSEVLGSDVNRLTALWLEICERHRDATRHELHELLLETLARFPVYRTYVRPGEVRPADERVVVAAIAAAKQNRSDLEESLFDFLADLLLLRVAGPLETELAMRFQQLSGPVEAKAVEDTAFYRFHRLVARNEVGGDPAVFATAPDEFHRAARERGTRWPRGLLATSTHDTKRSEDVRARIGLLAGSAARWEAAVRRWSERAERHRRGDLPDRSAEYLLYQILVGAWPISPERAAAYMEKAVREAKRHTSWTAPDLEYEAALAGFVTGVLSDPELVADLESFVGSLREAGWITSLAQTLVKLTSPGIPDLYQGTELWDLSLVDPDNRRPVDFDLRRRLLAELEGAGPEEVWARREEGLPKLWVIQRALALRRERPDLLGPEADHRPVAVNGAEPERIFAFVRGGGAVTVVPRLLGDPTARGPRPLAEAEIELPGGSWLDVLGGDETSGGPRAAAALLRRFPVALLVRTSP
jgi:(1->4)-alpha-D-glucan 1-alpha-D-glucosylmutase